MHTEWNQYHQASELYAHAAHQALRGGDLHAAQERFSLAAEAETQALEALNARKSRTRGIIAVSASALWFKAGQLDAAYDLARRQLFGVGLPEFATEQLKDLIREIESLRAKAF